MGHEDIYPAPAAVKVDGTDLGKKLSVTLASISDDFELLTKMDTGRFWTQARFLGSNLVLNVNLAEATAAVAAKIWPGRYAGGVMNSRSSTLLGRTVPTWLQSWSLVPTTTGHPALTLPAGLVLSVGPYAWDEQAKHQEACTVTVAALYDEATGESWYRTEGTGPTTTDEKTVLALLQQIHTRMEALQVGGTTLSQVRHVPRLDLENFLRVPRFPAALIFDAGGTYHKNTPELRQGSVHVAIVDYVPRDHDGQAALESVEAWADGTVDLLGYSQADAMWLAADSEVSSASVNDGLVVYKVMSFGHVLRRTTS
ncbi:MAG: hypothetical protein GY835_22550 [bacterium]|nr:hypothetical protein [bacterium]